MPSETSTSPVRFQFCAVLSRQRKTQGAEVSKWSPPSPAEARALLLFED